MIASQEREFKINKVIFKVMIVPKVSLTKFHQNRRQCQELFMSEFQYQNNTK